MSNVAFDVFFGEAHAVECRAYVRAERGEFPADARLCGAVIGPSSLLAHTLTASVPLVDRSTATTLLAEAVLPDPCFWTPAAPFLYEVRCEIRARGGVLAAATRSLGVRPLGRRGRQLMLQGKPWVIRAAELDAAELGANEPDWQAWREAAMAIRVAGPPDAWCAAASRHGVLLIGDLSRTEALDLPDEVGRLARWPALGIATAPHAAPLDATARRRGENLLFAQATAPPRDEPPAEWAQIVIADVTERSAGAPLSSGFAQPVIARRKTNPHRDPCAARRACDELQRDLAPFGQFAGYLV